LDRNVTQFGETFAGLFANLSDWAMALAVISALAFALARLRLFPEREAKAAPRVSAVTRAPVLEVERTRAQWARTSAAGRPSIACLQVDAASNIDAAEHALNRLLAECAAVMTLPMSPTLQAQRELKVAHGVASPSLAA
jgi:hypothetical protein